MKKTIVTTALGTLFALSAYAQSTTTPIQTETAIKAQVDITQDMLKQVKDELSKGAGNYTFRVADYKDIAKTFQETVDSAFLEFEKGFDRDVTAPLKEYMNNYNSAVLDPKIGQTQKEFLLTQLNSEKPGLEKILSEKYQILIDTLFNSMGSITSHGNLQEGEGSEQCEQGAVSYHYENYIPQSKLNKSICLMVTYNDIYDKGWHATHAEISAAGQVQWVSETTGTPNKRNWRDQQASLKENVERTLHDLKKVEDFAVAKSALYYAIFFPMILNGCRSKACLAFHAADLKNYLSLVKTKVNRDQVFKLADHGIKFKAKDGYEDSLNSTVVISHRDNPEVDFAISQLLRVDYPAQNPPLPFDTP